MIDWLKQSQRDAYNAARNDWGRNFEIQLSVAVIVPDGFAELGIHPDDSNCNVTASTAFGKMLGLGANFVSSLKSAFAAPPKHRNFGHSGPVSAIRSSIGLLLEDDPTGRHLFERSNVISRTFNNFTNRTTYNVSSIVKSGTRTQVNVENIANTFAYTHTHTQLGFVSLADVQTAISRNVVLGAVYNTKTDQVTLFAPISDQATDGANCVTFDVGGN